MIRLQIKVDKSLSKALIKAGLEVKVRTTVLRNASEMQTKAQKLAAVDTGFMKRSIGLTQGGGGLNIKVSPTAEYAPYVEYGTRYQAAQPFMRPAFQQQEKKFKSDVDKLLK